MVKKWQWRGNITPIEHCEATGKTMFDKRTAVTARNKRWDEAHVKLRVYECPYCHAWHLTSTNVED